MGTLRFREAMPLAQVQVSSPLLLVLQPAVAPSPMLSIHRMHQSPAVTGELVRMQIPRTPTQGNSGWRIGICVLTALVILMRDFGPTDIL